LRRLFERAKADLAGFIEQRQDLCLLAACSDDDVPLLLQLLRDLDQASASDLFLLFSAPFDEPAAFVRAIVEQLAEEHRAASAAMTEAGKPPLPPFPPALLAPEMIPWQRLEAAVSFARTLLPGDGGHRLVWALAPARIADRVAYLELVAHLLPRESLRPWMPALRLVVRDQRLAERAHPLLRAGAGRTRLWSADFGPEALATSLLEVAGDEAAPTDERMQALLSSALLDQAHGRPERAVDKLKVLRDHFHATGNRALEAFVMNAIGDVFRRLERTDQALRWYECALEAVADAQAPVVLATVVNNLGGVSFERRDYPDAEEYFIQLDRLASAMLDPQTKALALEWRGLCQDRRDLPLEAIKSWEAAATLCRSVGLEDTLRRVLARLQDAYGKLGLRDRARNLAQELDALPAGPA
jgi:hypothetical protein